MEKTSKLVEIFEEFIEMQQTDGKYKNIWLKIVMDKVGRSNPRLVKVPEEGRK